MFEYDKVWAICLVLYMVVGIVVLMNMYDFNGYDEEGNYFENDLGIPIYDDANMDCIVEYRPIRLMKIKSIVTKEQFQAMEYEVK